MSPYEPNDVSRYSVPRWAVVPSLSGTCSGGWADLGSGRCRTGPLPPRDHPVTPQLAPPLAQRAAALIAALGLGQAKDVIAVQPLTGGVASDIARVDLPGRSYCVKFALSKLRVAADWYAPIHRSRAEYAWLSVADAVVPGSVPRLFGYADDLQGFAMEYIAPATARLWKADLLAGQADPALAARLGLVLGRIHAHAATPGFDAARFRNGADFHALRVEPYLLFTARAHPGVAARLTALAAGLDRAAVTLVHGDVSPKNILIRAAGPVLLDAECASMGDPAFDLAFCLNHLALKSIHLPPARADMLVTAASLWHGYAPAIMWEPASAVEARVAALVPALMLARVDGKSPVEYLTPAAQAEVRAIALHLLARPVATIADLLAALDQGAG